MKAFLIDLLTLIQKHLFNTEIEISLENFFNLKKRPPNVQLFALDPDNKIHLLDDDLNAIAINHFL